MVRSHRIFRWLSNSYKSSTSFTYWLNCDSLLSYNQSNKLIMDLKFYLFSTRSSSYLSLCINNFLEHLLTSLHSIRVSNYKYISWRSSRGRICCNLYIPTTRFFLKHLYCFSLYSNNKSYIFVWNWINICIFRWWPIWCCHR